MDETDLSHKDIAMLGDGYYSRVSLGPKAVVDNCLPLLLGALQNIDPGTPLQPLTIADYGAADGGTSLDVMRKLVCTARKLYKQRPINVVYTDLPGADYSTLFRHVNNEIAGRTGYTHDTPGVHVYSSGRSFYDQILAAGTVDLAFSASAMHYLSRMPIVINDHVHAVGATASERAEFRAVALQDWQTILLQRSCELSVNGRLVMANFCVDEAGRYLGNTGGQNMFDNYNDIWAEMRDQSLITDGEYRNTAFQQYYKSIEDSVAPLQNRRNKVYQSGLRLDSSDTRIVRCPFRKAFEEGSLSCDEFARQFVNTHRSWTSTTFTASLLESRSERDKQRIVGELYRRFEERVRLSPNGYGKDLLHLYMVCRKGDNTSRVAV